MSALAAALLAGSAYIALCAGKRMGWALAGLALAAYFHSVAGMLGGAV